MKVEVVELDRVRKKVEVVIPEETITGLREDIFAELKRHAKIKGFRPGKIPRAIIASYYRDYIEEEVRKRMIQGTMAEALTTAHVTPVTEPVADFIDEEGKQGYTLECEVLPEVDLPEYKGIEVEVEPIVVTEEEIDQRIDGLRHMHAEMIMKEGDSVAEKGDFVVIKYQGYLNGKALKDVGTEAYPMEMGQGNLMPEFENGVMGMKAGEEKEIEINFPADYPDKDIASKKVLFKVFVREIRQKRLPEVNDDFAKDVNFENLAGLRDGLRKELEKEKEKSRNQIVFQKIGAALIKDRDIPVPKRLLENRIEAMVEDARNRIGVERMGEKEERAVGESLRKEFEPRAQDRIKTDIVLMKIADKEGITVGDTDVEERLKKIAEDTKRPYSDVRGFYENYNLMDGLKNNLLQEKILTFLKNHAVLRENQ